MPGMPAPTTAMTRPIESATPAHRPEHRPAGSAERAQPARDTAATQLVRLFGGEHEVARSGRRGNARDGVGDQLDVGGELGAVGALLDQGSRFVALAGVRVAHGETRHQQAIVAEVLGAGQGSAFVHAYQTPLLTQQFHVWREEFAQG